MKYYKVTTLRGFGEPFIRTVEAESEQEAMAKVKEMASWNEIIAFCEEV